MNLRSIIPLLSSILLGLTFFCSMHYNAQTSTETFADTVETCMMQRYKDFSGTILVAKHNTVLFKKAYGYANYEFNVPNDFTTRFPIASNTKLFTAVAIMLLQEEGKLHVHDALDTYAPGFQNTVTIHHLLTHTSGIPNYYKRWDDILVCNDLAEMIDTIKTWPLDFEPGSRYCYSNTGYLILAHIIEKVSGLTYDVFLQERIFKPFNMRNTGSICSEEVVAHKASGYITKDAVLYNAPSVTHPLTLLGSGNLYSTVDDIHIFMSALFSALIISKESLDSLLTRHVMMEGSQKRAHGYGCFIDVRNGKEIVEYSGALVGFLSAIVHIVDDNTSIMILTNCEDMDDFAHLCEGLLEAVQNG